MAAVALQEQRKDRIEGNPIDPTQEKPRSKEDAQAILIEGNSMPSFLVVEKDASASDPTSIGNARRTIEAGEKEEDEFERI